MAGAVSAAINRNKRQLQDLSILDEDIYSRECISEIHLCFNYISEVPAESFVGFTHLTYLSLSCNNLTAIPSLLHTPQLRQLHLANNHISVIEHLEGVPQLECLNLACNKISALDNITNFTELKELWLSGNCIENISWDGIPSFPYLHSLGLYSNRLIDFDELLLHLSKRTPSLRALSVGCNPFSRGWELSLSSAVVSVGHVDGGHAREVLQKVRGWLSEVSDISGEQGRELEDNVKGLCRRYARGRHYERLLMVALMLGKLKSYLPSIISVDNENLTENDLFSSI